MNTKISAYILLNVKLEIKCSIWKLNCNGKSLS
jgi:hypothetical protein